MAWRETIAKASMEDSTVESAVSKVRSLMSVRVNLREVLVMGGGDGVATLEVVLTDGGGTEGEAKMARGGVVLRSTFFDTGDEGAGVEWVPGFIEAAFFLKEDFVETCFFVPGEGSIIVSHADFDWGFVVDIAVAF